MERIGTWIRKIRDSHRCCPGHDQSEFWSLDVNETMDKPTLTSIHTTLNKPVAKPAGTLVDKSEGNHATGSAASRHIGVQVVSILDEDDTAAGAIAKGLAQLAEAKEILKDLELEDPPELMVGPIADTVIHLINIMAKVHDDHKPRRVQAHHVFATRTGVASYINIRNLIMARYKHSRTYDREPGTAVDCIFTACVYLGMVILVTPGPYSENLAVAVGDLVRETADSFWSCLPKDDYKIAHERMSYLVPDITGKIRYSLAEPLPPLPDLHPPITILTSEELAGLARALVSRQRLRCGTACMIGPAAKMLGTLFAQSRRDCPCRHNDSPVCFCKLKPLRPEEYPDHCWMLLPYC
ncbi:hypothetical protein V8F33_004808 [Rhypophila sp. PSN 637]